MQAVNLLPEYARPSSRWTAAGSELSARRILPIGGAAAIGLALIFGALYFHERSIVNGKKSQLATAQARLVAQSARAEPIKQAQTASQARVTFVRSVTATRVHWDTVLGDLGSVLPPGVSLTSLAASNAVTTAGSSTFTIAGSTSSHTRVALILDRLALLPWLRDVVLQSTTRSGTAVTFAIGATFVGGSGS